MRVSSSKSGSHRAVHNGKALTGLQLGRHLPCVCIYMCVCVEYRHICMPTFPQTKNQRVHSRSSEVNPSGPRNSIVQ